MMLHSLHVSGLVHVLKPQFMKGAKGCSLIGSHVKAMPGFDDTHTKPKAQGT